MSITFADRSKSKSIRTKLGKMANDVVFLKKIDAKAVKVFVKAVRVFIKTMRVLVDCRDCEIAYRGRENANQVLKIQGS